MAVHKKGGLFGGSKKCVMTLQEWQSHPQRMLVWGADSWKPALYQAKGSPINVILSDRA